MPLHSFKHAATLQHLHPNNPQPLLLRVDKKAGHGAGKSTEMRYVLTALLLRHVGTDVAASIREYADKYGFIAQTLGLKAKDA